MALSPNPQETAMRLAQMHFDRDPFLKKVYYLAAADRVRMVEVTDAVGTTREIFPIEFGPDPSQDIFFPIEVILLSPFEETLIRERSLRLPQGWGTLEGMTSFDKAS